MNRGPRGSYYPLSVPTSAIHTNCYWLCVRIWLQTTCICNYA